MNIKNKLENIPDSYFDILQKIGEISKDLNLKSYLVGGMIRDILLGIECLDIDITVENDAIKLAKELEKKLDYCSIKSIHERFYTAKVLFTFENEKIEVDLATTRKEIYAEPAALPIVEVATLSEDLIRRDFRINALAVSLLPDDFGDVVDLYGGLNDLENKFIRILPNEKSFVDDPTRMIRAVRFFVRFKNMGFEISEGTKKYLDQTIQSGVFDDLISDMRGDRVRIELENLFNLENFDYSIEYFYKSGIYKMVSSNINILIHSVEGIMNNAHKIQRPDSPYKWLIGFSPFLQNMFLDLRAKIYSDLQLSNVEIKILDSAFKTYVDGQFESDYPKTKFGMYKTLSPIPVESIYIIKLLVYGQGISNLADEINGYIDEYLKNTSKIKLEINGDDLIQLGFKPGKAIRETLEKLLELKIENALYSKEDEINAAKSML